VNDMRAALAELMAARPSAPAAELAKDAMCLADEDLTAYNAIVQLGSGFVELSRSQGSAPTP
jgi:hypothetical protein